MVDDLYTRDEDGTVVLFVHAHAGAGRTAVIGRHGQALKVKVAVPPEAGKANDAVAKLLADSFGLTPAQVTLLSGQSSRQKRFKLTGTGEDDDFRRLLEALVDGAEAPGGRRGQY
jgi:uncharacterized protein (TIGR00251 family)